MLTNENLLSKKRFMKMKALPDIELTAQEADQFIDYVIDQSFWNKNARIVKMNKSEKNIRYLGYGTGRFLKPADHFSVTDYKKEFYSGKIALASKKVRGAIEIFDDDLEDNIEGQAFADHLMKVIAAKVANELDEAYFVSNADYANTDIRNLWEGFRYILLAYAPTEADAAHQLPLAATKLDATDTDVFKVAGGIVERYQVIIKGNATGVYDWEFKFAKMLNSLPSKYKARGLANLRFFCNDIIMADYVDALAKRSTILGDNAILGKGPLQYMTVPITPVPLMPANFEAYSDGKEMYEETAGDTYKYADCILTTKNNFIIGLQRELKLESQRVPEDEAQRVFYSMRADLKVENPEAAVIVYNLTHS